MDWSKSLDNYCERLGPEFWAEPVNAITNAGFVIMGLVLLAHARRIGRDDGPVTYLGVLICVIGVGSFLFHTFATLWSVFMDTIPISLFIVSFFAISLSQYFRLSLGMTALGTLAFLGVLYGAGELLERSIGHLLGGSHGYLPALAALIVVGAVLGRRGHPAAGSLLLAGAIFAVSLTLRTLDLPLCTSFPLGTHFAWHLLNACVLGTLLLGLIRHGGPARG